MYLEQPKVLKNVRFPLNTLRAVSSNLSKLNIEVDCSYMIVKLDPLRPAISSYFRGARGDMRYGPQGILDFNSLLLDISSSLSDGSPRTINVVVFGAISKRNDLIRDSVSDPPEPPQPVKYDYNYKNKDFSPDEFLSLGTATAISGDCPSVFLWSDYWWIFSKKVNVDHEKALARAMLHELGHHLLMFKKGKKDEIIDSYGHLSETVTTERKIMNGYNIVKPSRQSGRFVFHSESIRKERKFLKRPTWHPRVEKLIRQAYIPLKQ